MRKLAHLSLLLSVVIFISACGKDKDEEDGLVGCSPGTPQVVNGALGAEIAVGDSNLGGGDIAQSFVSAKDISIKSVVLPLKIIGSPDVAAEIGLSIQRDNAGIPSNINHANARGIQVAQINQDGNITDINFTFAPSVELKANQKYWLRMTTNLSPNPVNLVQWFGANTNPLPNGEAKFQQGINWSNSAGGVTEDNDLLFQFACEPSEEED